MSNNRTSFKLPRDADHVVMGGILAVVILLVVGIIGLASGRWQWGLLCLGFSFLAALFICYQTGESTVVFDDDAKDIFSEDVRCCGNSHTTTLMGGYASFIRVELKDRIRGENNQRQYKYNFVFRSSSRSVGGWHSGNKNQKKEIVRRINSWWNEKQKHKVVKSKVVVVVPPQTVQVVVQSPVQQSSEGQISSVSAVPLATAPISDLQDWMENTVQLPYTQLFIENDCDSLGMLQNLSARHLELLLTQMGIPSFNGHRERIMEEVAKLQGDQIREEIGTDTNTQSGQHVQADSELPGHGVETPPPAYNETLPSFPVNP